MSQSELDQLLDQLSVGDSRERRNAAKRLGELRRPETIAELANVYAKDEDAAVQKAAGDALRNFRRMEQRIKGGDDDDEPVSSSGLSAATLLRIRTLLVVTLAITVIANVALRIGSLFPPVQEKPTLSAPTPRDQLIESMTKRIADARADADLLQKGFRGLQGLGAEALKVNKPICQKLQESQVSQADLADLDAITYPDLPEVNVAINLAALRILALRTSYVSVCSATLSASELNKRLADLGGAAKLVSDSDEISNKYLGEADILMQRAISSPAPTVGPTFTPSNTPTHTSTATPLIPTTQPPPTATRVGATAVPVATGVEAGAVTSAAGSTPASGATSAATATPKPTLTPIPSIKFDGLHWDTMKSYQFSYSLLVEGTYQGAQPFSGSIRISAAYQTTPLKAQVDLSITEVGIRSDAPNPVRGQDSSLVPGTTSLTVQNNTIYVTGAMLDKLAPGVRCQPLPLAANQKILSLVQTPLSLGIEDIAFTPAPSLPGEDAINGVKVKRYHGESTEQQEPEGKVVADLYLSADDKQLPIRVVVVAKATAPSEKRTKIPGIFADYTETAQYDLLAQNPDVKVVIPSGCEGAPSR